MELRNSFEGLDVMLDIEDKSKTRSDNRTLRRRNSRNRRRKTYFQAVEIPDETYQRNENENDLKINDSNIEENKITNNIELNDDEIFEVVTLRRHSKSRRRICNGSNENLTNNTNNIIERDKVVLLENGSFEDRLQDHESLISESRSSVETDGRMSNPPIIQSFSEVIKEYEKNDDKVFENDRVQSTCTFNTRHLPKSSTTYEVENFERNAMVIFNHVNVNGYKPRKGTEKDVEVLKDTFSDLGFEINTHEDYTKRDIFKTLDEFSNSDFTHYGCVAVVVLTHGSDEGYLRAKDRSYHESELLNYFKTANKPTLVTKPKVFIVQACRGTKVTTAAFAGRVAGVQLDAAKQVDHYTLPTESDILFLHSTYAGNAAHREELNGSWFIQALCKHVKQLAGAMDVESIMTEVLKDVAINKSNEVYNRVTGQIDINKQMPVKTSTLIRKLYLKKVHEPTEMDGRRSSTHSDPCKTPNFFNDSTTAVMDDYYRIYIFSNQHFVYLRNVLKQFLDEGYGEGLGLALCNIAWSIDVDEVSMEIRDSVAKEIRTYLRNNAKSWKKYNMIFLWDE